MIQVVIPVPLRTLARHHGTIELDLAPPVTQRRVLDALEQRFPMLRGTMRDQLTGKRRAYVRLFSCGQDLSDASPDDPLPEEVVTGREPYRVVGALAGG